MNPFTLIYDIANIFIGIARLINRVQINQEQCARLHSRLEVIVNTLRSLNEVSETEVFCQALITLKGHVQECADFIQEFTTEKKWLRILKAGKYRGGFARLNQCLEADLLQLNLGINIQQLMNHQDDELDRKRDAAVLQEKQDEILKLMKKDADKLDDIRQMQSTLLEFLREELQGRAETADAVITTLALIEAEELEYGVQIAQGEGLIYRGRCRGQDVAMKKFNQDLDEAALEHFKREVQILERLRSDYVVLFYGACIKPRQECLVMKYMNNGSLSHILDKKQSFTPEQQKRIALEIVKGLQYLHSQGIVHRDLRDRHILFDEDWHAKLTGFGFSKIKASEVQTAQTAHELSFWSAPELFGRGGSYTVKSDIYSFGLILWELFAGRKPYRCSGLEPVALLRKINSGYRETIPESIPQPYSALIRQCWDADPSRRPSLEVIIHEIESYMPPATEMTAEDLYKQGAKCEKDKHYREAAAAYQRSAAAGYTRAKTNLGLFFLCGVGGLPKDPTRAFALLSESAAMGHARAQFNLGVMLETGDGIAQNREQSLYWYQKAAEQGDAAAKEKVQQLSVSAEKTTALKM